MCIKCFLSSSEYAVDGYVSTGSGMIGESMTDSLSGQVLLAIYSQFATTIWAQCCHRGHSLGSTMRTRCAYCVSGGGVNQGACTLQSRD